MVTQQSVMQKTTGAQTDTERTVADQTKALIERAKSKNPKDRADAISSLMNEGKAGDTAVRKVLEEALIDKDANVRAQAISSLTNREGDNATAELQEALHDSDASVRLMAVGSIGNNAALLQQALTDSDATVRELAAMKLESLSNEEPQQPVMQKSTGAQTDTEYTAPDQTNALIEKAGSKNPSDRSDAIAELQEALHDNDASVRLMAVNSIGNNADLLQQALTDSDAKVRELAAMKLESLSNTEPQQQVMQKTPGAQADNEPSTPDQIDALLERAKSNNPVDRVDAISRLLTAGKAGDASVRTVLEEALADNYASVRAQAISSLARSEGDDATAALQVALNDSDASVRLMAVDSMGSNTALLQQALTDNDATVRELAKIRLESLSNTTSSK